MAAFQLFAIALASATTSAPAATREAPVTPAALSSAPSTQRYCIVQVITGSRIPKRVCHTRSDWMDQGVDPLAGR